MGTWNLHASSHRLGYYIYIFAKTSVYSHSHTAAAAVCVSVSTTQENEVLKFPDLREEDAVLDSGAECAHTHTHDAVCGSL